MTLDIILLIATIVVAVLAVIVGLIRAVLERRRGSSLWEQYRSRRIDPQRLERAVPGPTAEDGTIRALEKQAPAMGSRPGFATLGAPVAVELIGDTDGWADDASPAHPYAYAYARESDAPDAEIESVVVAPAVAVADPEAESEPELAVAEPERAVAEPELDVVAGGDLELERAAELEPEPAAEPELESAAAVASELETEPGLSDASMAELGINTKRKRRFGWGAAAAAAVSPPPVDEVDASSDESVAEPVAAMAAAVEEPVKPSAASAEPVPLFLPGTYTEGAADLEEPAVKRGDAPTRAAAMTAGYAPTARAVFVPPPPDAIEDELAYRIGVRGARRPEQAATEVADGPVPLAPVLPTVETEVWPERRGRARRRAAIGMTAIAAAVVLAIGANTLPGLLEQSGVLSATGQPPASAGGGVPLETPSPSLSAPPQASPSPAAPSPSPSPSAAATPRPTRNTIRPPIARFDCTSEGLVLTCDGSKSSGATDYMWDFGEDATVPGATASHAYRTPGSYLVTLTVTGPSGTRSRSQSFIVP